MEKTLTHPCYNEEAKDYARIHLAVAPKCNIKCNYCNRKFDCMNETRPGVTSEVLLPFEALKRYMKTKEKIDKLSVVGIAGPGDALANFSNTKETLSLIRQFDPEVTFCLSTNGLMLDEYIPELIELGVSHVTVTMNAIDPWIGAKIYSYINYKGTKYTGEEGASLLIDKQLSGIKSACEAGLVIKINTVAIQGVNDHHIESVIQKVASLGVYLSNIVSLIPVAGTKFETIEALTEENLNALRNQCGLYVKQMRHCRQCRSDAVGKLDEDHHEFKGHSGVCRKQNVG